MGDLALLVGRAAALPAALHGDLAPEQIDELVASALQSIDDAIDGFGAIDAAIEFTKSRAAFYSQRAEELEATREKLRAAAVRYMQANQVQRLEGTAGTISLRRCSGGAGKVLITDASQLPEQYWKSEPDKPKIRRALQAGMEVPGADLELPEEYQTLVVSGEQPRLTK